MCKFLRFCFASLLVLAVCALSAMAQSTVTGAISGTVMNPNKEVVTGATVTAKNNGTNKEATATTDDNGGFKVTNLDPGTYTVTVNASGFAPYTNEGVTVEVGRSTPLDVGLSLQGVTSTVQVTSEAPVINTSQQDFATNVNQTSINELPINGRRASSFVLLTPGVVSDGNFLLLSFRGISGLLNNNTVDGGNNNNMFFSEEAGRDRTGSSISQAAVREFQVNTSNYSAEYGRAAGGVINTVTKSGTNNFHGQLFYYLRDNKWGARNPRGFNALTGAALKPVDKRHQFGGAIGGPIVKDKAFFFFTYDQQKREFPAIAQFDTASFLTTLTSATTLTNLTARGVTQAQIDATSTFLLSLTGQVPRRGDQRLILPKIDWNINSSNTFTFTYNRLRFVSPNGIQTAPTVARGKASFGNDFVNLDYGIFRLSSTITPKVLNEARVKIGKEDLFQFSQPPLPGEPTTGLNGRSPSVAITNGLTFGKPNFLERLHNPLEKTLQIVDNISVVRGNHSFKFGVDYLRTRDLLDNLFQEGGVYAFNNLPDFIVDYVNFTSTGALRALSASTPTTNPLGRCSTSTRRAGQCYTSNYAQGFGVHGAEFDTNDWAFYIQDDWRWSRRLTVNLGLRYEVELLPNAQFPNPIFPQTSVLPSDKNNFGPRGGFAYDVKGDGKTSVRGGIGVYYGRLINSTISNAITNTGIDRAQLQVSLSPATAPDAPVFPNVVAAPAAIANPTGAHIPGSSIVVLEPGLHLPTIIEGDIIVERQIARNTVISASYITSRGRFLPTFINKNIAPATATQTLTVTSGEFAGHSVTVPVYTARLNSNFFNITEVRGAVDSAYHGLVLQANRRMTNGLQFQASYTRSIARDNGQTSQTFTSTNTPTDPYAVNLDRGRTSSDIPHRFVASAIWSPKKGDNPFLNGWTFSPIVTLQSGRPYSPGVSVTNRPLVNALNSSINGSGGDSYFIPLGRNSFRQPKIFNVDARLSRRFKFTENANLEVLVEAFNLFNRTQITSLNTTAFRLVSAVSGGPGVNLVPDATFGTDSATGNSVFRERQVQIAIRFNF
ncbi:MAG TPA: carboxypeptidase regulatory-like domain-containing protein [Pyrinomonadaceae bacterium]|nr:carboxypeptidase regulatory-like domain-containing protein [Pyrinomonadaceae bacterium]